MAKLKVFCAWDNAVGAFLPPYCLESRGLAVRAFIDAASNSETQLSKHPHDFSLFELAEYDTETGQFTNLNAPLNLGSAASFLSRDSAQVELPLKERVTRAVEAHSERNMQ